MSTVVPLDAQLGLDPTLQIHEGKVRNSYRLPSKKHADHRLVVASDRISAFDFILNGTVKDKGAILTALNIFWRRQFFDTDGHDLVAYGPAIDEYGPWKENRELQKRAVVVSNLEMIPVECVVRGYLTGSAFTEYKKNSDHTVWGHILPAGLVDGSPLPVPIFTPTTKEQGDHDKPIDVLHFRKQKYGWVNGMMLENQSIELYKKGAEYAASRGIILADTKFEWGTCLRRLMIGDEIFTPDSSRFWDVDDYTRALKEGRTPTPFDKQFVRDYCKSIGINKRDPKNPKDVEWVIQQTIPADILAQTSAIYHEISKRLTKKSLDVFQQKVMKIKA